MPTDKLQKFLVKQGSNPQQSVQHFLIGLVLFLIGVGLIYLGIDQPTFVQILGLTVICISFVFAVRGYIGIVANRIAFFRHQAKLNRDKYKNIK
ncbi:MAG: hypothetical protein ACJAZB_001936 [Psychrosphaera sp.]|jgi:hypothetical protein|uniref:hypothetical protein n=1 Tax=Psychrosphaera sp. F3M07 TaxID=2841560 RepID=UPI001C095116|nr:hypothetical protein [Psychrosphaera sp. F3M07]MBU2919645.1 hypothetical protein [Psychrosphaera sp. F3M07]